MRSANKIIDKLRKPPAVQNWVKNIKPRRDDTAFALHNFALNPPRTSLATTTKILGQIVVDDLTLDQALKCASGIKDPASRERARHIINAFHPHAKSMNWQGVEVFRDMVEYFPVSAGVRVPVRPTFVLNDGGSLVPYFVICWSRMDLSPYQCRILSTLIHHSILTLEEFQNSDAFVVCTPRQPYSKYERKVMSWSVDSFELLDELELARLFDRYAGALDDAERMIIESIG